MHDIDRRTMLAGASILGAAAIARAAKAGQLGPPMGPIMPTGKSLRDVEPRTSVQSLPTTPDGEFVITQGGSYYLTDNIDVSSGKSGIFIVGNDAPVCIDLMGFTIRGVSGSSHAIACAGQSGPSYLEIYDGFIRDCDGDGINGGSARVLEVNDVHISHCDRGIVAESSCIVEECHIEHCASDGLLAERVSPPPDTVTIIVIDDCSFRACGGHGIALLGTWSGAMVALSISECDCVANGGDGMHGSFGGTAGLNGGDMVIRVSDCICSNNGGFGLHFDAPTIPGQVSRKGCTTLEDISCAWNAGGGMRLSGLHVDITCCTSCDNLTNGFEFNEIDGEVDACVATRNTLIAFALTGSCASSVCDCTAHQNGGDGIYLDSSCTGLSVTECECRGNGAGFRIDGSNNLLLWNTASGNAGGNFLVDPATPIVVLSLMDMFANPIPHANYSF